MFLEGLLNRLSTPMFLFVRCAPRYFCMMHADSCLILLCDLLCSGCARVQWLVASGTVGDRAEIGCVMLTKCSRHGRSIAEPAFHRGFVHSAFRVRSCSVAKSALACEFVCADIVTESTLNSDRDCAGVRAGERLVVFST